MSVTAPTGCSPTLIRLQLFGMVFSKAGLCILVGHWAGVQERLMCLVVDQLSTMGNVYQDGQAPILWSVILHFQITVCAFCSCFPLCPFCGNMSLYNHSPWDGHCKMILQYDTCSLFHPTPFFQLFPPFRVVCNSTVLRLGYRPRIKDRTF